MIYYISDLHLGDRRVFELCHRPFSSLKAMEEELIKRWNNKITKDDEIYVLGDIANGNIQIINDFFSKVKGRKHLILGNHDEEFANEYHLSNQFIDIDKIRFINDQGRTVCLCHYPIMDWMYGNEIIYHIYGHIHNKTAANNGELYGKIKDFYKNLPAYNASADVINFEPRTLDELIRLKEEECL